MFCLIFCQCFQYSPDALQELLIPGNSNSQEWKTSNPLYKAPDIPSLQSAEVHGMDHGHYEATLQGSLLCLFYLLPVYA